jgi:membrane-bound lytic murein transglycosylase B
MPTDAEAEASPSPTPDLKAFLREPPSASDDPAVLAEQLITAERAIRDPAVSGEELAWMAHLQQLAYKRLVQQQELRAIVLAALPAEVQPAAVTITSAAASLRSMISPGERLPPWRIVEPTPADDLLRYYKEAEADFGVGWPYLASIHLVETVMGRIRGTSVAGAQGPMQFIPATWAAFGQGDINDTRDSIRAAARYLRASGAPAQMEDAIFAYNPDRRYVAAVMGYASVMASEPNTFRAFYNWQVYYLTPNGDVHLPVGYLRE